MVFDVDRDASWYAADEAGLPAPTWIAINRRNGHGHLAYRIDTPVRLEDWNGRRLIDSQELPTGPGPAQSWKKQW